MPGFIHTADVHLDSPMKRLNPYDGAPAGDLRSATRGALENLVQYAVDQQAGLVLMAGDLFDRDWRDFNSGLYLAGQLARLHDEGIQVVVAKGNHDAQGQITRHITWPPNTYMLSAEAPETKFFDDLGIAVHGQSFPSRSVVDNLALAYPDAISGWVNVGALHTSLDGRPNHDPYAPCTVQDLCNKGYEYFGLGHVHTREVVSSDPWIIFPGCLQGRHPKECGPKGATFVTYDAGGIREVTPVTLDVARWAQVSVPAAGATTPEAVLDRVKPALAVAEQEAGDRLLVARIVITGMTSAHGRLHREQAQLEADVRAATIGRIWIEGLKVETSPPREATEAELGVRRTIADDVEALLSSPEALSEFAAAVLGPLRSALPAGLRAADGLDLSDPAGLAALVSDAREFLLAHLEGNTF